MQWKQRLIAQTWAAALEKSVGIELLVLRRA